MDLNVLVAAVCIVGFGVLFSQWNRLRALERSLGELRQWHTGLMWRVYGLETAAWSRPSTAYRTTASEHAAEPWREARPMAAPAALPVAGVAPAGAEAPSQAADAAGPFVAAAPPTIAAEAPPLERGAEQPPLFDARPPETLRDAAPAAAEPRIDWERWIGVRGAAALGAGILVIALLYFLSYSIDAGWLTIGHRVVLGATLSALGLAVSTLRLEKTHAVLSQWVSGASIAGLYASVWAGEHLASFFGPVASFALVLAVTALAIGLALRKGSLPIALLGVSGAFAAPLSLAMSDAAPGGIVAYVVVLDVAMVALAMRKRWWVLALVALGASSLYEAMWMHSAALVPSAAHAGVLVVLAGIFGALPAFAMREPEGEAPAPLARVIRFASVLVPLAFAARLAVAGEPEVVAVPLVSLVLGVVAVAIAVARRRAEPLLALAAVAVSGAVLVVAARLAPSAVLLYPCALVALTAAGAYLARSTAPRPHASASVWLGALALAAVNVAHREEPTSAVVTLGLAVALGLGASLAARAPRLRETDLALGLLDGSRAAAFIGLGALACEADVFAVGQFAAFVAALAVVVVSAKAQRSFVAFVVVAAATLAAHGIALDKGASPSEQIAVALVGALLLLVPFVPATELLASGRGPEAQAATLTTFGLVVGVPLYDHGFASAGAILGGVAATSLVLLAGAHLATKEGSAREAAQRWLGGLGLASVTATLSVTLHDEILTSSLALLGLALLGLHKKGVGRGALAGLGTGYLGVAAARLLLNPLVLAYHPRGTLPVIDWITPAFLVPAACAFAGYRLLATAGARPLDRALAKASAALGLALVFGWLNVAVLDVYSRGDEISFAASAGQARDLAMSFAWALFGVALLVTGMARGASALRKASLAIILVTMAKVFLYDLAALGSLYRVASLVGLAISLIGVSVLYQRFVFGKPAPR